MPTKVLKWLAFSIIFSSIAGLCYLYYCIEERGKVYPQYSSLRADAVGTEAWYETLNQAGLDVSRNYQTMPNLLKLNPSFAGKTFFVLGVDYNLKACFENGDWQKMMQTHGANYYSDENWTTPAKFGGRVVATLRPGKFDQLIISSTDEVITDAEKMKISCAAGHFEFTKFTEKDWPADQNFNYATNKKNVRVKWFASRYFSKFDKTFKPILWVKGKPVALKKKVESTKKSGKPGQLILIADSYFISNQGLKEEPAPAFLSYLIGKNKTVIIDETHLEVSGITGIMLLIKRYNMQYCLWAILIIGIVFVWKSRSSLLPPDRQLIEKLQQNIIVGESSAVSMNNLITRSMNPKDIVMYLHNRIPNLRAYKIASPQVKHRINEHFAELQNVAISNSDVIRLYENIGELLKIKAKNNSKNNFNSRSTVRI